MSLIEVVGLEKYYNKGKDSELHALHEISFEIEAGEMTALMGVSGSGKSTLLNILGFMDSFDAGVYRFNGEDVSAFSERTLAAHRNRSIGFVMQSFGLILSQTVYENVSLPLLLNSDVGFRDIKPRCVKLIEEVGLKEKIHSRTDELSGGQQQRVAIARAMANEPKLLIADEPTGALDSATAKEIVDLFIKLNRERGMTVIVATHDERVADACSRVLRIEDGRIVSDSRL